VDSDLYLRNTSEIPQDTSEPASSLLLREGEGACRPPRAAAGWLSMGIKHQKSDIDRLAISFKRKG
jgi:hypothetical protein